MTQAKFAGVGDLPADLKLVEDVSTGRLKFGVTRANANIFEPRLSVCGRFEESPQAYGLTDQEADAIISLNRMVEEAIEEGLNNAVRAQQDLLGVQFGDIASRYFSGRTGDDYHDLMVRYVMVEIRDQREDMEGPSE